MTHKRIIERELEGFGIRLNKQPPDITFRRRDRGGITMTSTVSLTKIDEATVKAVCREYRIASADFSFKCDATVDDVIDIIEGTRVYIPALYVLNKIDQLTIPELDLLSQVPHYVMVSAHHEWNLDELLEKIWEYCKMIRIYTKPKGQIPDYNSPVVLHSENPTVEDFCNRLHRSIVRQFKYALVWGTSVKHNPQRVGKDHLLDDEDIVQIVKRV